MKTMVMCCLPSLTAMKVDGQSNVAVTYDPLDLLSFLQRDFVYMNAICERGEMFESLIYDRSKRVFEYFGLTYYAPPPPI
jgi:hypothetical protein